MSRIANCILASATLAAVAGAQHAPRARTLDSALERWRSEHGANWRMAVDDGTGYAEFVYGGSAAAPFEPADEADWFRLARLALAESEALHGIEGATLIEDRALFLPLGMAGGTDKMTVRFRQAVGGVPVDAGSANVLFTPAGKLLSVQTHALPRIAGLDLATALDAQAAAERAVAAFADETGLRGSPVAGPELVVAQVSDDERRVPRLAWKVDVQWLAADAEPEGAVYYVDAKSGEIADRAESIHHLDVGGTVTTRATPGTGPDLPNNPETQQVVSYARVQSSAGTVFTDVNGNFNYPGVNGPLNCTFTYVGTFNNVLNDAGTEYSLVQSLTGTGNQVLLNPVDDQHVTAQANAFVGVNLLRDWIRSINPLDSMADFVHTANCNINSSCNAFFNGNSINFFIANGGCPNTCYSTVIAHEDGHWLNVLYGTTNGGDGIGEGNADVFAMYIYDTNIVAQDFFGPGQPIRDGLNTRQFCGDCCGGCHGGVHNNGEVWMGAAWKIRRNLNVTHGDAVGDALSDSIFMAWMNAYDQTQIKSVMETQWLTLDDDDANLSNGTPNFFDIDGAFQEQGFPGVPFDPIALTAPQLADTTDTNGPYVVGATASSNVGATISSVTLRYRVGWSGPYASVAMTPLGGPSWSGSIPGQAAPSKVFYYVEAADSNGSTRVFPAGSPGNALFFGVGSVQLLTCDAFDVDKGWVANGAGFNQGDWERGDPIGSTNNGFQAQPETDNPAGTGVDCLFTDQGTVGGNPNEADVDGGPRIITAPPVQVAFGNAEVRYAYWFYNDDGDDSLLLEVSNDGANWFVAKTHSTSTGGWVEARADVRSVLSSFPVLHLRFSVTDSPNNSVTEAAVDDVCVATLTPNGCAQPIVFCAHKIDSGFCGPRMSYSGLAQVGGNQPLHLNVSGASAQRNGLLFYGYGPQIVPFKGGALCVDPPLRRTPLQSSGGTFGCTGSFTFDFNALIRSGSDPLLVAGQEVSTQYFYRDPLGTFQTALSDGVTFTICP